MVNKINAKTHLKQQCTTIHLTIPLRPLRKRLPQKKGICLLAEEQQRWGQPSFPWEEVPEGGSNERATSPMSLPRVPVKVGWD